MRFNWQGKHWIVFAVLLVCQALGLWALAQRSGLHNGTLRVPFFFIPLWVVGSVFLTTVVVVEMFTTVFPNGRKSLLSLTVFWVLCIVTGVLVWRMSR